MNETDIERFWPRGCFLRFSQCLKIGILLSDNRAESSERVKSNFKNQVISLGAACVVPVCVRRALLWGVPPANIEPSRGGKPATAFRAWAHTAAACDGGELPMNGGKRVVTAGRTACARPRGNSADRDRVKPPICIRSVTSMGRPGYVRQTGKGRRRLAGGGLT
jgi:hypothetical protein